MQLSALIFDMDGVLINSEHLWRKAMIKGFSEFGIDLTEDECRSTMGMRFREVILLWLNRHKKPVTVASTLENRVQDLLIELINTEGRIIDGIPEIIEHCIKNHIPLGLATSSSQTLMNTVVERLDLSKKIPFRVSAESLKYAKPHPEVFLLCAEKMKVDPQQCLVIEDSVNGVIAARAAGMQVIAVPDDEHYALPQFCLAQHYFRKMTEVLPLIKSLLKQPNSYHEKIQRG